VSKTVTFFFAWLSVKKAVRFSVSRCFSVCRFHTYSLSAKVYKEFGQPAGGLRRPSKIGPVNLHRHRPRSTPRIFLQRQHSGERWGAFPPKRPGGDSPSIQCNRVHPPTPFPARTSPKILSLPLWHGHRANRQTLARLISQGGWSMNTVQSEMQETGAGNVPSPSPSAPPPWGRFPIDTLPVNSIPSPGFRREPSC
jgi:hypothetical protein